MNQKMTAIKATEETRTKLKELTKLLNNNVAIGKVRQTEAIEYAIDLALTKLKND